MLAYDIKNKINYIEFTYTYTIYNSFHYQIVSLHVIRGKFANVVSKIMW